MAGIQPFDCFGGAEAGNSNIDAVGVGRFSRPIVVGQFDIVDPTVDDDRHQQLQIQPDIKVIGGGLLADVMYGGGFVKSRFYLRSTIARYKNERVQGATSRSYEEDQRAECFR